MKKFLLSAAATAAILAAPTAAYAQTVDNDKGWYLRGNFGYGAFTDMELSDGMTGDVQAEGNGAGSIGIGYDMGNDWRLELDGGSMWNDLGAIDNTPSSSAKFRANTLMFNIIRDLENDSRWTPFVGAGVGIMQGKLDAVSHNFVDPNTSASVTSPVCNDRCAVSDEATEIAWNLIAGLGYDISDRLTWDTQYRYISASDMDFDGTRQTLVRPGLATFNPAAPISVDLADIGAHQIMTGFRLQLGNRAAPVAPVVTPPAPVMPAQITCWDGSLRDSFAQCPAEPQPVVEQPTIQCFDGSLVFDQASCPTPPPPPPPPVIVEQQASICDQGDVPFVVYFEWDQSRLTDQAQAVIDQASVYTQQCGVSGVTVEGFTDTSGAAAYNVALSNRRADTVSAALVARGVDSARISKTGYGEERPAVSTEDGVREPLNRRSEVVIRLVPTNAF